MVGHGVDNRRHGALAILLLAALALAFWASCLFGGKVPVAAVYQKQMLPWAAVAPVSDETRQWDSLLWDSMAQFYPWRLLLHRAAQSDQLPLWNPYQFCGYPFVGNGQSAMFYPLNWLYFVIHPKVGLGLSAALHYFLGGLFVFGLARAWRLSVLPSLFAALAFTYGGFMVTWIELPTLPNSLIWLPLAWWGIEVAVRGPSEGPRFSRPAVRGLLMLSVALGMTLLAGHFQIAAYVWIFAFLYAIIRLFASRARIAPRCGALLIAFILALMLAMAQLLPTLELGKYSARGAGGPSAGGFEFHRQRALQPVELLTLLTPDFLGSPVTNDYPGISYSEHCGFVGAVTLLLGLAGLVIRRRVGARVPTRAAAWLFGGIALFALWGAMAGLPAMLLYWGVPKLGQAGGFARLLSVWTLGAAMWGGVGLQAVIESIGSRASFASAGRSAPQSGAPQPDASASGEGAPPQPPTGGGEEGAAADRGLKPPAEGPAADRPADGRTATAVSVVAVALLLVQVLPWAYRFNPRAKAEEVYPETELIRQLRTRLGSDRYVAINDRKAWTLTHVPANVILPPNAATVYGLRCVDGYDSLFPMRYRMLATYKEGGDPSPLANGNMLLLENGAPWARWNVADAAARAVWRGDGVALAENTPTTDPVARAFLWTPIHYPREDHPQERTAPVAIAAERLNHMRLDMSRAWAALGAVVPGAPLELRVDDELYPGWYAGVDGLGRRFEGLEYPPPPAFRRVSVRPGEGVVDMLYFPASVACGLFMSLLALAAIMGIAVFGKAGRGR
jgi:hypothetical protein